MAPEVAQLPKGRLKMEDGQRARQEALPKSPTSGFVCLFVLFGFLCEGDIKPNVVLFCFVLV